MGGRVPGAGPDRRPGRVDLPLGADLVNALDPQPVLRGRVDDRRSGRDGDLRPAQHDQLAAARGLERHPLRPRVLRLGIRRVARTDRSSRSLGADRAVPGSEEAAVVSVTSHTAVAPVRLILRVGAAPSTLPQGGSVAQQCSQASGYVVHDLGDRRRAVRSTRCRALPSPWSPRSADRCVRRSELPGRVRRRSVVASWSADAPGATCSASFSVQRRAGATHERRARRHACCWTCRATRRRPQACRRPPTPTEQLTLRVDPGEARLAYPALTGFVIRSNGQDVAQCAADGACPPIAAPNGEQRTYDAFARNGVGDLARRACGQSRGPTTPRGAPAILQVRRSSPPARAAWSQLRIEGIDPERDRHDQVSSPAGETVQIPIRRNDTSVELPAYRVGSNTVQSDHRDAVLALRAAAGPGRQPLGRGRDGLGQRHRRADRAVARRSARHPTATARRP